MSKYYTPSPEEFHIGFEYQIKNKGKWINTIFNDGRSAEQYIEMEIPVRVKHLDKEDIESLGWNVIAGKDLKNYSQLLELDLYGSINRYKPIYWELSIRDNKVTILKCSDNIEIASQAIFIGTIKNKSELKNLMIQLGINK